MELFQIQRETKDTDTLDPVTRKDIFWDTNVHEVYGLAGHTVS